MRKNTYLFFVLLVLLSSCSRQKEQHSPISASRIINAQGYLVPDDSIEPPVIIAVENSKLKKVRAAKPNLITIGQNTHPAFTGNITVIDTTLLTKVISGIDNVPLTVLVIDSPFVAGVPVRVTAKDPYIREQNSQNFSTYGKLQGLTHGNISAITEDRYGNIWLGTYGGGVSRYDGKNFTHFTTKEGLSNNSILCILEDSKGNIWFGTNGGGINRYDGYNFTHYNAKNGQAHNIILCICEDNEGSIWFGTEDGGALRYNGSQFSYFTTKEGLSGNRVTNIKLDKKGTLWFGTNGGVTSFNGKQFTHLTEKNGLAGNKISCITESNDGDLWFGTDGNGVSRYDGKTIINYSRNEGLSHNVVSGIIEDSKGHIWISTNGGGISEFDGKNFTYYTEKEGLSSNAVRSIFMDSAGNLWMGTWGQGLSKLDRKKFTHYTDKEGLSHKVVSGIVEDEKGGVWLATGIGISYYNQNGFTHYTEKEGLHNNTILSIMRDTYGNIWTGSLQKGLAKFDGTHFTHFSSIDGLGHNDVRCILEDKNGHYWFGTSGGGVTCYDGNSFKQYTVKQGLSSNDVRSIMQDKAGNMWFGTIGGGATCFDGKQFTHYTQFGTKHGIGNNGVLSIMQDKQGIIWFGTNGSGVMRYDGENFIQLTESDGLSNNVVQSIIEDAAGNLWFGTRFGLSSLPAHEKQKLSISRDPAIEIHFRSYSFEDGFFGIGVNGGKSLFQSSDGRLWIGANDRLTVHHPDREIPDTIAPQIQLTSLSLFSEKINWEKLNKNKDSAIVLNNGVMLSNIRFNGLSRWHNIPNQLSLSYNNNYLTFSFIGITMNRPQKVRYQYILEGNDLNWSAITDRTEANYGNLPPGKYTFKVRAMNSEGYWSMPAEYSFTVRPPWWQTWWAYSAYFIITISSIALYIRWRESALKERQRELEITVDKRTAEVIEEKKIVEIKNKEILDSIAYAKRIQTTILPSTRALKAYLEQSFVLYMPKDIVAGDFYWLERVKGDSRIFFAACDCTGHGVPGAMVSVVCHNALNKALHEFGCRTPAEILDKTSDLVIDNFNRNMDLSDEVKDGMDASVCAFDPETGRLIWAGANNPLLLLRKGEEITELKANKQHVGRSDNRKSYTNHFFELSEGDVFYLITDGFADQFGGDKNKKFQKAKLRALLFSIHHLPMEEQRVILLNTFEKWRGNNQQVDDVTIIGVRV